MDYSTSLSWMFWGHTLVHEFSKVDFENHSSIDLTPWILPGPAKTKNLPAIKHESMEKDRCIGFILPWYIQKKMTNGAYKKNPRKINKANCTFYLLRSGNRLRLPNSILFIKYSFYIRFEWFQIHIEVYL